MVSDSHASGHRSAGHHGLTRVHQLGLQSSHTLTRGGSETKFTHTLAGPMGLMFVGWTHKFLATWTSPRGYS